MLMDAWREGDQFVVEFDLPGVGPDSVDLDINATCEDTDFLAAERPRGVLVRRQLVLGDNLDQVQAGLTRRSEGPLAGCATANGQHPQPAGGELLVRGRQAVQQPVRGVVCGGTPLNLRSQCSEL